MFLLEIAERRGETLLSCGLEDLTDLEELMKTRESEGNWYIASADAPLVARRSSHLRPA
jgi:hypothetical protein